MLNVIKIMITEIVVSQNDACENKLVELLHYYSDGKIKTCIIVKKRSHETRHLLKVPPDSVRMR